MNAGKCFTSRMNTRGLANCFMDQSLGTLDINRRLCGGRFRQFLPQTRARLCVQEIPEQEQVEMSCRSRLRHISCSTLTVSDNLDRVSTTRGSGWVRSAAPTQAAYAPTRY